MVCAQTERDECVDMASKEKGQNCQQPKLVYFKTGGEDYFGGV